jgi:hypothetical protein
MTKSDHTGNQQPDQEIEYQQGPPCTSHLHHTSLLPETTTILVSDTREDLAVSQLQVDRIWQYICFLVWMLFLIFCAQGSSNCSFLLLNYFLLYKCTKIYWFISLLINVRLCGDTQFFLLWIMVLLTNFCISFASHYLEYSSVDHILGLKVVIY